MDTDGVQTGKEVVLVNRRPNKGIEPDSSAKMVKDGIGFCIFVRDGLFLVSPDPEKTKRRAKIADPT